MGSAGTPRDLEGVIRIDFGDSSGKSDKIGETKYLKGLHPFNSELLDPPHCLQQDSFDEWFLDGFNDQNKYCFFFTQLFLFDVYLYMVIH